MTDGVTKLAVVEVKLEYIAGRVDEVLNRLDTLETRFDDDISKVETKFEIKTDRLEGRLRNIEMKAIAGTTIVLVLAEVVRWVMS